MAEMFASGIVQVQKEAMYGASEAAERGFGDESERDRKGKNMAQSMAPRCNGPHACWADLGMAVDAAMQRVKAYRSYRRRVRELSALSGHELADLGLHRSEIRRVAHDSVYGALR